MGTLSMDVISHQMNLHFSTQIPNSASAGALQAYK